MSTNKMSVKIVIVSFFGVLVFLSIFACGCSPDKSADLVVYGNIYTAEDDNNSTVEAFAVKDEKYVYVGDKQGVKNYIKEGKTEVIDKGNQGMVMPGATEGHSHYFGQSSIESSLPVSNCSYNEMLNVLKAQVEKNKPDKFLSFGWQATELKDKKAAGFNFADEIDKIAPDIPVVLISNSAHDAVCNTAALQKAGFLENTKFRGGEICLDTKGKPSGFVKDEAVYYIIEKAIGKIISDEQYCENYKNVQQKLLGYGYTNALDAFTNLYDPSAAYENLKKLDDEGNLNMNVAGCFTIKSCDAENYKSKVDEVDKLTQNYKSKHSNPAFIKLFADGVVESATGWMLDPYKNVASGKEHGNIVWQQDELNDLIKYANSKNILVHTHTYGDAACNALLNAYIASNKENSGEFRNSLGHARNIKNEDIKRAAENKIPIAENLVWHQDFDDSIPLDAAQKQAILSHISEENYYRGYPMKSLVDNGVIVSSSTDAPAAVFCTGNIQNVIEVATTGIIPEANSKPFSPSELLTVKEALKALTINGAWQLGLEKERGSIKVGKYADFLFLDKNILNYQGEQLRTIHNVKILNTYFEGKNVYESK